MNTVFLLLNSNVDAENNLRRALTYVAEQAQVIQTSSVYETPAVGEGYTLPFLDVVVKLLTALEPDAFHAQVIKPIEVKLGRCRGEDCQGLVTIDMDILLWNADVFTYGSKPRHVPDPNILTQIHLAVPLAELVPDAVHPVDGRTFAEIAAALRGSSTIAWLHTPTDWME